MQRGIDINGEIGSDQSGLSVSLSTDGNVVTIGGRFNDGNGSTGRHVRVFRLTDPTAPTIAVSSNVFSLKAGETTSLSFSFSEAATDFTVDDVSVSGSTLSNFSGSSRSYSATFTPTADSTFTGVIDVSNIKFFDLTGNNNQDKDDLNNTVTLTINTSTS